VERPERTRVLILGAAGRDFHDFNVVFRDDPGAQGVAFTAAQIPGIEGRHYPPSLSGPHYPDGIPIVAESQLEELCEREDVDEVVFAYSDLSHPEVMHLASRALACGADFRLLGPERTMLRSRRPVIAVSAVRTGCGKSQTARWIARRLRSAGRTPAVLRHPMPYGHLAKQRVQRFASREDLDAAECTIEEREEYEPYVDAGGVIFAGVDYAAILEQAERECDVVIWDGGNNDCPFVAPGLHICLVDALRPDQVATHHPGEAAARMADVIVVNKVRSAGEADAMRAIEAARAVNPRATILRGASPVVLDEPERVRGARVLVVDDGPTLTHGGMRYGAGYVAAVAAGAAEIVDPRATAPPRIRELFERYPHLGPVLPAAGYDPEQRAALRETIEKSDADCVVAGTPTDLAAELGLAKPVVRARYEYEDMQEPGLGARVDAFLAQADRG
jgi:predicted GTPase